MIPRYREDRGCNDDPGGRPEHGDQAEEPDVVGHLVDHADGRGRRQRYRAARISPCRRFCRIRAEGIQGVEGIDGGLTNDLGQRLKDVVDILQFTRAMDLRGERRGPVRPRSSPTAACRRRKTGRGSGSPQPRRSCEKLGRERGDHPVDEPGMHVGVVGLTFRRPADGLKAVGDVEAGRGPRVETARVQDGPEGEVESGTNGRGQIFVVEQPLDRLDLGLGQPAFEVQGQSPVGIRQLGQHGQGRPCRLAGQVEVAPLRLKPGQRDPRGRQAWVDSQRLVKARLSLVEPALIKSARPRP